MVDARLFVVSDLVVVGWFRGTKLYEVDTNAVIGKRLTMHVTDGYASLEELLVLLSCCLVLSQVVI
jgi:hypothetical protein